MLFLKDFKNSEVKELPRGKFSNTNLWQTLNVEQPDKWVAHRGVLKILFLLFSAHKGYCQSSLCLSYLEPKMLSSIVYDNGYASLLYLRLNV